MDKKLDSIVSKVAKLYHEYGIKGVTMDDVAHKLAISKKTLYQYFNDKKELVWAVLEYKNANKHIDLSIFNNNNSNALDEIFYYYDIQVEMIKNHKPAFVYDLRKYYPDIYTHFQKIMQKKILESVKGNLIKGKKEGLYREDIDEDILSRLSLMRIEGLMNSEVFTMEEVVSTNLFSEIFKYNLYGIVSDKGREMISKKFNNTLFSNKKQKRYL